MRSLYYVNVSIHVLAAVFWLGGLFFLAVVGAPVLRRLESAPLRARLFRDIGRRFRTVGWTLIAILLITGVLNLFFVGLLDMAVLGAATFWSTPYGRALAWKLGAVALMLALSASHDFVLGPAASRLEPGSPGAERARRSASWLARLTALAGLAVVLAAVRLARGG